ncbi:MAG TPA: nucleotidyltransferase domain-containing protein [Puia sp.]|nr:nucleotidyltransferase domain-containing protein [Puia sp.]
MILPQKKEETLNTIVADLKQIENIMAIVLGGSYAMGTVTDASDLDIGIYYYDKNPFRINDIKSIAKKYATNDDQTVTGFYEWGPWVNGGAWIETASGKVDFLYRNIEQVRSTIDKAKKGELENHFEQQPPYGFSSVIYLGETRNCIPFYDPDEIISKLKSEVQVYPIKLKETIIQQSLWSAEFTIWHADYFLKKQDIYNTMGCLTRAVKNIVNTLFALNEIYQIGDKRAIEILEKTEKHPQHLKEKIENILCANKNEINNHLHALKKLFRETIELSDGLYKPYYKLKER